MFKFVFNNYDHKTNVLNVTFNQIWVHVYRKSKQQYNNSQIIFTIQLN